VLIKRGDKVPSGIILFGSPGSGTTSIGRELASRLAYPHIDLDDHHWRWNAEIPYTVFRSKEERIESLMAAIAPHPHFVMSGSMWSIRKSFEPLLDLAGYVSAPAEIRAERVRSRELTRWGSRVLPGGDMYATRDWGDDYLAMARSYDTDAYRTQHEQWANELQCPVLRVDGTRPVARNAELMTRAWRDQHSG
jgi:hypothetical protein